MDESLAKSAHQSGILILLIAASLIFGSPNSIATTIVYGIDIPGLHQKDGNGVYDKIAVRTMAWLTVRFNVLAINVPVVVTLASSAKHDVCVQQKTSRFMCQHAGKSRRKASQDYHAPLGPG